MLSWKGFQVSTKLSYAIYLTQFPVFFFNVGRRRHIHHYYNFVSIILDTNEYISIFLASVALTIFFDAPFQNIKKLLINRAPSKKHLNVTLRVSAGNLCDSDSSLSSEPSTSSVTNTRSSTAPPLTNSSTLNGKVIHAHID